MNLPKDWEGVPEVNSGHSPFSSILTTKLASVSVRVPKSAALIR